MASRIHRTLRRRPAPCGPSAASVPEGRRPPLLTLSRVVASPAVRPGIDWGQSETSSAHYAVVARARSSLSPRVVMRGIQRWSTVSALGLVLFVLGIAGYATGFSLMITGVGKIFAPHEVGAWLFPGSFSIGTNSNPAAREVLGWWLIPVGLGVGSLVVVATTRLLRWTLRFARIRRPTAN
jgi:hypothetical protein